MNTALDEIYEKKYKKLNAAQREAVDTIDGPVMVIAGPGTGKTTILTLRIATILKKTDIPPSGILAITYTEAGVKAMKKSLREIIGSRADEVKIYTFHGFASAVITEFRDHFVHLEGMKQMEEINAETLIMKILEAPLYAALRPLGKPDFYLKAIMSSISDAKREDLLPNDIRKFAEEEIERMKSDESLRSTRGPSKGELKADAKKALERLEKTIAFSEVYEAYEEKKKEAKLMDFDDLIFELLQALRNDSLLLSLLQEKFLYIHIDEHQDTNDSQNSIIKLISTSAFFDEPNIFIVGDEKQAIYRFQGASVRNFLSLKEQWPKMQTISLEENYRSHQHILDASYGMIENNYLDGENIDLRVRLKTGSKKEPKPIELVRSPDIGSSETYLIDSIKRILSEEPEKTIAVISRNNQDVDRSFSLLESAGVSVSADRSVDIFSHPSGALFFSLAGFLNDPLDVEGLSKSLAAGLFGFDFSKSIGFIKSLRKGDIESVVREIPVLEEMRKMLSDDSPVPFIIRIAEMSGYIRLISSDPLRVEVWRKIVSFAENIVRQDNISAPALLLEKLIAYKASSERKKVKIKAGVSDARVKAMTAHGSKGLEFDYVFIPYASEGSWISSRHPSYFALPVPKAAEETDVVRDDRRLFYVALTRAKEHVTIIASSKDSAGEDLLPLRFIEELDKGSIKDIDIPQSKRDVSGTHIHVPEKGQRIIELAKETLAEKGLSVTALNHFMKCPSEFLLKSILKIPEAPSASAEKGNAMHLALDHIWRMKKEGRNENAAIEAIKGAIRDSLKNSFLARFEKDAVEKELMKNAPAVAKSLQPHFHTEGEVQPEEWKDMQFEKIILHGKLDAVIDTGDDLLVFDYKTKGKMSENEIRGKTKTSDGGYFRQLVFYRLLLENQHAYRGKRIIPSLVFLTPDEKGECKIQTLEITESDIEIVRKDIRNLIESVWSGEVIRMRCDDPQCEWCSLISIC